MMRHLVSYLALLGLLASPGFARADRRELYTVVEVSPQVTRFHDPVTEKVSATSFEPGGSLAVYYGVTNSIHVGGALHFAISRNLGYSPIHVILRDGGPSDGALYVDATSLGATLFTSYRFDTGGHLAPVVQADVGLASCKYSKIVHVPAETSIGVGFPSVSETVLELRASARAEYRFSDHLVGSVGAGAILDPGSLRPWALYLPIAVGWVW